jgi:penicillin-binding protein 2B
MKERIRKRALLLVVFLLTLFLILGARLYYIQTANAEWLVKRAQSLWERNETIEPKRGAIVDRNGRELAYDAPAYTVIAFPDEIEDAAQVAAQLGPVLNMSQSKIVNLISSNRDKYQVELRNEGWKISEDVAEKVRELNLEGIDLIKQRKRYYPAEDMAANIIGYTDKEGKPRLGVEHFHNESLSGTPGSFRFIKDLKGYRIPNGIKDYTPASHGDNVVLTVDMTIQHFVEKALDTAAQKYNPKNMIAIVSRPSTGEVLAMAVRPNFNPNEYWNFESFNDFRNSAINYTFEPGSTFKIVTLAAAIEEGVFEPNAMYKSGRITGDFGTIRDHNGGRGWGENQMISYFEGVLRSSNVAFVKMGYEGLGKDRLYSYIDKFGFGRNTGIDIPNEMSGVFAKRPYARDVANTTFGQGMSVTAIQQVAALSAIANGGKLMKPYIVKEIRDSGTDQPIVTNEPKVVSQVISEDTAQKTRLILEKVVEDPDKGTGHRAFIEGYRVAGKTGTAQIIKDGQYIEHKYIASFIGFAPADDPELVIYVMVEEPDIDGPYGGGSVAAPIFKDIMWNSLRYLRVAPEVQGQLENRSAMDQKITLPDLGGTSTHLAEAKLKEQEIQYVRIGNGPEVVGQIPKEGTKILKSQRIYILTEAVEKAPLPNLQGYSLVDALELCSIMKLSCETMGQGYVAEQGIPSGTKAYGRKLTLTLREPEGDSSTNTAEGEQEGQESGASDTPSSSGSEDSASGSD